MADAIGGWVRKHYNCVSRRRRGGCRVEFLPRLPGLRISFKMSRISAKRSLNKEILYVVGVIKCPQVVSVGVIKFPVR